MLLEGLETKEPRNHEPNLAMANEASAQRQELVLILAAKSKSLF